MTVTGREAQITDALFARVKTLVVGSPALPIAWPEVAFSPPASGKYLRIDDFPNRPAWEGISSGRLDQGLLQIMVVWPKNQGLIAPRQIAAQVIAHFPKGLAMFSGSTRVRVSREAWASSDLKDDKSVLIPITIPWTA